MSANAKSSKSHTTSFNDDAARLFRECARLLAQQDANPFRVNAYRRAAETLESMDQDVREIRDRHGLKGLIQLPAIGKGLAAAIDEIAHTGCLSTLDRLRGEAEPEALIQTVPGIGPELAHSIHDRLHIDSLEGLQLAAHDGRLETLPGIGPRRAESIRANLKSLLGRKPRSPRANEPPVNLLLDVDRQYRVEARKDVLPKLAPRRFNPDGVAWLPILHTDRDGWHFTALYSNTARAHELGRTHDWVVVYFYNAHHQEGQVTVVTETRGPLKDLRVVRGREKQSGVYYRTRQSES